MLPSVVLRCCGHRTLSSAVKQPPLLTSGLRQHLFRLLAQYHALQEKANSCSNVTGAREDGRQKQQMFQQLSSLEPVVLLVQQLQRKEMELADLEALSNDSEGGELRGLARQELSSCHGDLQQIQHALLRVLVPCDAADEGNAILEVRAGVGGKEAALFTLSIFHMYQKWAAHRNWHFEVLECDYTLGFAGYKHASASLSGLGVYRTMKHESGVHRVQRVPATETQGRIHTSTTSVVILPQPTEIDMVLNLKDIKVETHKSSGPGGQSVNTTDSAVRLTHIPTGFVVRIQDDRSQHKNRAKAMKILSARVYDCKRSEAMVAQRLDRQQQMGSGERHERIRTYNFPHDRVTDHRVDVTVSGVQQFMEGQAELNTLLDQLQGQEEARNITQLLDNYK